MVNRRQFIRSAVSGLFLPAAAGATIPGTKKYWFPKFWASAVPETCLVTFGNRVISLKNVTGRFEIGEDLTIVTVDGQLFGGSAPVVARYVDSDGSYTYHLALKADILHAPYSKNL